MKRILFLVLFAAIFAIPAKAQDPSQLTLAIANQQLTAERADLKSQVASLEIRLQMAQARIAELEKSSAKPQPVVITVQPDPSEAQVNREAAANLRVQRALAIAGAFKAQAPQVVMPRTPVTCSSQNVGVTVQTVCQ
jgi:hypothetical protein